MMSSTNQADISPKLVCLRAQYRLTQLYHFRTRLQACEPHGQPEKVKGQGLQNVPEGDPDSLSGKQKDNQEDDAYQGDDVVKERVIDEDDDSMLLNPCTEGYLFQSNVLRDTSWPLSLSSLCHSESQDKQVCLSMTPDSPVAGNQVPTQEQLVDRILNSISGTHVAATPSQAMNGEHERYVNGTDHERSSPEAHTGEDTTLVDMSQTLRVNTSKEVGDDAERSCREEMPSGSRNDIPGRTAIQELHPGEQSKHETEGNKQNSGQTLECPPTNGALHKPLDKALALISSMKNVLLKEHPTVLSIVCTQQPHTLPHKETTSEDMDQSLASKERIMRETATNRATEDNDKTDRDSACIVEAKKEERATGL